MPLGRLAYARSGDKGGDANVGVWIPADHPDADAAYEWLVGFLDEATVRELLPEAAELKLEIHPLPNLRAVNIVIHGLLGEGVASSTRLDPQAKGLGEWLRARDCAIPSRLAARRTRGRCAVSTLWETPERTALREMVTSFTEKELVPHLPAWEDAGEVPREVHAKAASAGLLGVAFPSEVGGQGGDLIDGSTVTESLIQAGGSIGTHRRAVHPRHRAPAHRRLAATPT